MGSFPEGQGELSNSGDGHGEAFTVKPLGPAALAGRVEGTWSGPPSGILQHVCGRQDLSAEDRFGFHRSSALPSPTSCFLRSPRATELVLKSTVSGVAFLPISRFIPTSHLIIRK